MIIRGEEITLRRLQREDLELLRHWRNDPSIRQHMFFRQHITREMQVSWFRTIDNQRNHYFIIDHDGDSIGMIHLSDIDVDDRIGFAGLFIYETRYQGTQVPVIASLVLLKLAFESFRLARVHAKVRPENRRVRTYNERLGFQMRGDRTMVIDRAGYDRATKSLMDLVPERFRQYQMELVRVRDIEEQDPDTPIRFHRIGRE